MRAFSLTLFTILLSLAGTHFANASPSWPQSCLEQAEKKGTVHKDIFAIVIDMELVTSFELNQAMASIYSSDLTVLEWVKSQEKSEVTVFVTWPKGPGTETGEASQDIAKALTELEALNKLPAVNGYCVNSLIQF